LDYNELWGVLKRWNGSTNALDWRRGYTKDISIGRYTPYRPIQIPRSFGNMAEGLRRESEPDCKCVSTIKGDL